MNILSNADRRCRSPPMGTALRSEPKFRFRIEGSKAIHSASILSDKIETVGTGDTTDTFYFRRGAIAGFFPTHPLKARAKIFIPTKNLIWPRGFYLRQKNYLFDEKSARP